MAKLLEKGILAGLGVLTLTRDKVRRFVDDLVAEGEAKPEEAPGIIEPLVDKGEKEREELRKMVRQELEKARSNVPVITRKDIDELSRKIDALAAKLEELAEKAEQS